MIIDVHTHAFPDKLAPRAIATLEAECPWRTVGSGTVDGLLASMDAAGVDVSVVCPIATKPDQADGILAWCDRIRSERIEPFPSPHPDTPHPRSWIEDLAGRGYRGIKLHPMYQSFAVDEPRMERLYAACRDAGVTIAFHCGRDIAYPPDDDRAAPARLAHVAERFPTLQLLCTHMGGWRMWDQAERELLGRENVWLETSFSLAELGPERAADLIARHGSGRVLLGSDWPWSAQDKEVALLKGVGLSEDDRAAVAGANARRLLRLGAE